MKCDSLCGLLSRAFASAIAETVGGNQPVEDPGVRIAGDPRFGDYQCNAALPLAKVVKTNPRDLAVRIADLAAARLSEVVEALEVAGPGFINVRLKADFLARCLEGIEAPPAADPVPVVGIVDRVGLPPVVDPLRVVVEYSQPNIAKQMHVGHLRSTIIGDVFARVLSFLGHEVIRQNHIGDWGTQFGMLIRWYQDHPLPTPQTHTDVLEAIEQDYRSAQARFENDPRFADQARRAVAALQGGDPQARRLWRQICQVSLDAIDAVYRRLGVLLCPEDVRGESFYNDALPAIITELREKLAGASVSASAPSDVATVRAEVRDDQGAVVVYLYDKDGRPLFKNPDGDILGMIVQKSDGAYLYATTDLAAVRYRLRELKFQTGVGAQRVIYVTDARQKLHFQMFLATARAVGWLTPEVSVEHVTFGSVLGPDRKPLKTRAGGTVKLRDLLDEAERRAYALLAERDRAVESTEADESQPLTEAEKRHIASRVGMAAVKYADLRNDRNADYVFDWDKMITFQGNTAPYMMYAYARIRSIYRKAAARIGTPDIYAPHVRILLGQPSERALALRLARLREEVDKVATDLLPHTLCTYLYELAGDFMRFYENCPVLTAPDEATRLSRLRLCDLTARTLRLGLWLLGIEVLERM